MVQIAGISPGAAGPEKISGQDIEKSDAQTRSEQVEYKTFSETLKEFVGDVNDLQHEFTGSVEKLLTGEIKDVHDVMIAMEKAGTSFELMMEIRNKMIEAYHEVMRMQV